MHLTVFSSVKQTKGKYYDVSFAGFCSKLKVQKRNIKDGHLYAFKKYHNDTRFGEPLAHSAIV